jgi:hypothetical protein
MILNFKTWYKKRKRFWWYSEKRYQETYNR